MPIPSDLVREIEKLSPSERVRLIDKVIRDTIKPDPQIEEIWIKEAQKRWESFERGEAQPVSYDRVLAKYRKRQ